jgi:hypothetical protein
LAAHPDCCNPARAVSIWLWRPQRTAEAWNQAPAIWFPLSNVGWLPAKDCVRSESAKNIRSDGDRCAEI